MNLPISVVIPAYNAEPFLKAAIESVLRQSVPPLEVLVVDDGSTDGTASLARSIEGVRYVHQENRGVSAARNRGIAEASGRFIALLDADDAWREDKLAVQMARLRDGAFAYSARTETDAHLRPILLVESDRTVPVLEGLLFYGNVVGTPSSVIAPREALLEAGGFDLKLSMCADWDMWIRLALTLDAVYSPEPLLLYRVHEQSMSFNLSRYESDSDYMMAKAFALD